MLTRKPSALSAAYSSLHPLSAQSPSSTSSFWSPQRGTRQQQCLRGGGKTYATIADEPGHRNGGSDSNEHTWPEPLLGRKSPTPYQIFALKRNGTYSKLRYYELVKLYHPDRSGTEHVCSSLPHHIKIERYRLIVAANTILSDPAKRSAYDRFGAGWDGKADFGQKSEWRTNSPNQPFNQSWSDTDPLWQNATWEDWERWRERQEHTASGVKPERQAPLFMQNGYFVVLIITLALMGSGANYNRAQDAGHYYVEQRDIVHDRAAKELRKVRQDVQGSGREERIQWFLRNREATLGIAGPDVETMHEERVDRVLPDREICRSEDISDNIARPDRVHALSMVKVVDVANLTHIHVKLHPARLRQYMGTPEVSIAAISTSPGEADDLEADNISSHAAT